MAQHDPECRIHFGMQAAPLSNAVQVWLATKGATGTAGPTQITVVDVHSAQAQRHAAPAAVTCMLQRHGRQIWVGCADGTVALWDQEGMLCSLGINSRQPITCAKLAAACTESAPAVLTCYLAGCAALTSCPGAWAALPQALGLCRSMGSDGSDVVWVGCLGGTLQRMRVETSNTGSGRQQQCLVAVPVHDALQHRPPAPGRCSPAVALWRSLTRSEPRGAASLPPQSACLPAPGMSA